MSARSRTLVLALAATLVVAAPARADVTTAGSLRLAQIGSFASPTYVTGPPGDASRVVVVQQGGTIRIVRNGVLLATPFLTVTGVHNAGEQGLLSLAFAPDYATSGRLYVYYNDAGSCDATGANCDVRIDEYRSAGAGADAVDPATRRLVLRIDHKKYPNNNGGQLQFGPGRLPVRGRGGRGGGRRPRRQRPEPQHAARQAPAHRPAAGGGAAYTSPPSNPFFGPAIGGDEVWAYGLRNPWRFSFDRLTGDLVIGDVGQNEHEEVDFQPAGFGGGANYGWNLYEGAARYSDPSGPQPSDYVPPVLTYDHVGRQLRDHRRLRRARRRAGGARRPLPLRRPVRRGGALRRYSVRGAPPTMRPWATRPTARRLRSRSMQLDSFGEDAACRLYVASRSGPVYRLTSTAPPAGASGCASLPLVVLDRRRRSSPACAWPAAPSRSARARPP